MNMTAWAEESLLSKGITIISPSEHILTTPWSSVFRLTTTAGKFYLKQTSPAFFLEPKIMQLLVNQFNISVPIVTASNKQLHCFIMSDAGQNLRRYIDLQTELRSDLLCQAVQTFTTIQRSIENHIDTLFALNVPDWRLHQFPKLYEHLISQSELLKAEGLTDEELKILGDLMRNVSEQCIAISQFEIPDTLVQPDFNTNNMLIDLKTKKMTLIDLGEIVITHPFFSLQSFLSQAIIHHDIKEQDQIYCRLQNTYCENWLTLRTTDELLEMFIFVKKLWPIYFALAHYRLMRSVNQSALKAFYANRPNQLVGHLREYIALNHVN